MRPDAVEAMLPFLTARFANPSGAHKLARDARRAIDEARDELAELLGAAPGDIIYTSGGTEADNLAIFGAARAADRSPGRGQPGVVVCSGHTTTTMLAITPAPIDPPMVRMLEHATHSGGCGF